MTVRVRENIMKVRVKNLMNMSSNGKSKLMTVRVSRI